jgi:hypothetical protein
MPIFTFLQSSTAGAPSFSGTFPGRTNDILSPAKGIRSIVQLVWQNRFGVSLQILEVFSGFTQVLHTATCQYRLV